ncbi:DUF423 domain-containing protein [Oleiagrimonas sp.]|uniref:DUF423 domain-containing protein n=1 Tax=Oleiagrimonas sp. TaxID=2010330 RepID=UPI002610CC8A|nr:DUF423 domain-containing protein [Oleiagrimonas sp.]MDA3912608.1 DUF423 domain-containing protein [Oleiagrimonas sp.]
MRQFVSRASAYAAGLAGASAVLLGAFGAHALRGVLDAEHAQIWETAVKYQFWHALALVMTVAMVPKGRARHIAVHAFGYGIVLFSGSLYLLALGAPRWVGLVTPFGGVAFVVGWVALAMALARHHGA